MRHEETNKYIGKHTRNGGRQKPQGSLKRAELLNILKEEVGDLFEDVEGAPYQEDIDADA